MARNNVEIAVSGTKQQVGENLFAKDEDGIIWIGFDPLKTNGQVSKNGNAHVVPDQWFGDLVYKGVKIFGKIMVGQRTGR